MKWAIFAASIVYFAMANTASADIFSCSGFPPDRGPDSSQKVEVITPPTITPRGSFFFRRVSGGENELNTRRMLKEGSLEITKQLGRAERHILYQTTDALQAGHIVGMAMTPRGHVYSIRIDTKKDKMPFTLFFTGATREAVITGTCKK